MATFEFKDINNQTQTLEAPDATTALSQAQNIAQDSGVIEASQLTQPTQRPTVPVPQQQTQPQQFAQSFDDVIAQSQAETDRRIAEARQPADDIFQQIQNIDNLDSQALFNQSFGQQGGSQALQQLQDESVRLAQLQGKFRTQTNDLQTLAGQTKTGAFQDISEVERRKAIEVGNQALLVQALQGNVATARQIAQDTVNFAFQDQQVKLQNLNTQLDFARSIAGADEAKLLEREQQKVNKELRDIDNAEALVNSAIQSGASPQQMARMNEMVAQGDLKGASAIARNEIARIAREEVALDRSAKGLAMRKDLFSLASAGDRNAIAQLGYDPNAIGLDPALIQQNEQTNIDLNRDLESVQQLRNNKTAIDLSTGTLKGGLISSFLETGVGAIPAQVIKDDFLNEVKRLTGDYTLDNLIAKKAQGATFGALSNAELGIISDSASKLNSILDRDDVTGVVKGIRGSEQALREALDAFETTVSESIDLNNSRLAITASELQEINETK